MYAVGADGKIDCSGHLVAAGMKVSKDHEGQSPEPESHAVLIHTGASMGSSPLGSPRQPSTPLSALPKPPLAEGIVWTHELAVEPERGEEPKLGKRKGRPHRRLTCSGSQLARCSIVLQLILIGLAVAGSHSGPSPSNFDSTDVLIIILYVEFVLTQLPYMRQWLGKDEGTAERTFSWHRDNIFLPWLFLVVTITCFFVGLAQTLARNCSTSLFATPFAGLSPGQIIIFPLMTVAWLTTFAGLYLLAQVHLLYLGPKYDCCDFHAASHHLADALALHDRGHFGSGFLRRQAARFGKAPAKTSWLVGLNFGAHLVFALFVFLAIYQSQGLIAGKATMSAVMIVGLIFFAYYTQLAAMEARHTFWHRRFLFAPLAIILVDTVLYVIASVIISFAGHDAPVWVLSSRASWIIGFSAVNMFFLLATWSMLSVRHKQRWKELTDGKEHSALAVENEAWVTVLVQGHRVRGILTSLSPLDMQDNTTPPDVEWS